MLWRGHRWLPRKRYLTIPESRTPYLEVMKEVEMTGAQVLLAQGIREGREEGRQEGRFEILLEQLRYKFGPLSEELGEKRWR